MGFLGFGNYAKPGKGVKKGEAEKKRIFQFTELYFRKFSKLIQLNLLYVIVCIPSIVVGFGAIYLVGTLFQSSQVFSLLATIIGIIAVGFTGPPTAALMRIARYFVEEKPVFLMSDFFQAFKDNFKPAFLVGLINGGLTYVIFQAFTFYYAKTMISSVLFWIPLMLIIFVALVAVMTNFYTYLAMVSVDLDFKSLIKNCVSFVFLGVKTNFITLFFVLLILGPCIWYFPITIPAFLVITFSTVAMIVAFNSFQHIYKYSIKPYYVMNGLEDPYEIKEDGEESIFEDTTV
ncbi:MAG: DUF624 domain-containing protein [Oscillospiraceae bacterium]